MVAGTRVVGGRYELVEVLGAGGMATVWRARDGVLHREVAVKLLSPQYAADPGFLARFEREARHAAALSHPGLVTIFDGGVTGDSPFIVMELVAGQTLRQVLDQAGTLAAAQAVRVAAAVCEALEAVHAAGLVHRDIKPANIVLSGGRVKVLDFGIARAGGTSGGTRTQAVLGTAAYLSPEQASGDPAGPQSDLYSLGCVLFEMLTGTPPFTADTAVALAYRHVHDDPPPPSARLPGLPAALDQITGRLLAKDPAARPAGAAAARAHLLAAMPVDQTAVLDEPVHRAAPPEAGPGTGPDEPGRGPVPARPTLAGPASRRWPLRPIETVLATALAASLITVLVLLLSRPAGTTAAPSAPPGRTAAGQPSPKPTAPSSTPATRGARTFRRPRRRPRPSSVTCRPR